MKESGTLTWTCRGCFNDCKKTHTSSGEGVDEEVGKGKRKERKQEGKLQIEGDRLPLVAEARE